MIARTKDNIRKTIDFLIVLPVGSVFIFGLCDAFSRGRNSDLVFICSFILIFALLLNKWLKPKPLSVQIDRLREEEIHLLDRVDYHERMITSLERAEEQEGYSRASEIDSQRNYLKEKRARIDIINTRLGKIETLKF